MVKVLTLLTILLLGALIYQVIEIWIDCRSVRTMQECLILVFDN